MKSKFLLLGLATVAAISTVSLPAYSQEADKAVIQESTQDAVVTGSGNYTEQDARQINIENGRTGRGNVGTVQRSRQNSDVLGSHHETIQVIDQTNVENDRVNRRSRYGSSK